MRQAKRWRYYCDHCKKAGGLRHGMEIHEKHCTMNPSRECRMCHKAIDARAVTADMPELNILKSDPEQVLAKLRAICHNCPACILAVIRQSKSTVLAYEFRFKEEAKARWERINEDTSQREYLAEKAYL